MANTVYNVSTVSELYQALAAATGGETIRMASGDYGNLSLKTAYHNLNYDTPVTIVSADPDNPAIISEMTLNGASNITFEDITFKSYYTAAVTWYSPFNVTNSSDITFDNVLFEGTPVSGVSEEEDGTGRGKALFVENSESITVTNSEFDTWYRAMVFSNVNDLTVSNNEVHSIRSDGMNFAGVTSVLIEDNYIHDFNTVASSGDHADMIQFINLGNTTSTDVIIRGNTFDIGDGNTVQTLFMRNEVVDQTDAGFANFYQNITIEENVILNGHAHGITVGETNGLIVRNNTVLSIEPDDAEFSSVPYITVAQDSLNVVLELNVTQSISGYTGQTSWSLKDNVLLQNTDPQKDGFYASEIITSTLDDDQVDVLTVRSGGTIDTLEAGAQRLLYGQSDSEVEPLFNLRSVEDTPLNIIFDARPTLDAGTQSLPEDAQIMWDFGDGTSGSGLVVQHEYASPGVYSANLRVILNDGSTYTETSTVEVAGNTFLDMTDAGNFQLHGYGIHEDITQAIAITQTNASGETVLSVGNGRGLSVVPKEALARLFGSDTFGISMELKASKPGQSYGEIMRLDSSFLLKADANGDLSFTVWLDTGTVGVSTSGANINDGQNHDIDILVDGENNSLKLMIDGKEAAALAINGNLPGMKHWDLVIGHPFGQQTFDGEIAGLELNVGSYDYPLFGSDDVAPVSISTGPAPVVEVPSEPVQVAVSEPEVTVYEPVTSEIIVPHSNSHFKGVVAKEEIGDFFGTDNFEFSMVLQASGGGNSYGEIARIHDNFLLSSKSDGSLKFTLWLETGAVKIETGATSLHDGNAHNISISYDSDASNLSLFVDNKLEGSITASGSVKEVEYWDLTFGNPWGHKQDFDGSIEFFGIDVEVNDETGWFEQDVSQPIGFSITNPGEDGLFLLEKSLKSENDFAQSADLFWIDDILLTSVTDTGASDENAATEVLLYGDDLEVPLNIVEYSL